MTDIDLFNEWGNTTNENKYLYYIGKNRYIYDIENRNFQKVYN